MFRMFKLSDQHMVVRAAEQKAAGLISAHIPMELPKNHFEETNMRAKMASLHPLLILLAVALASVLFVVSCGGDAEPTEVPATAEATEAAVEEATAEPTEAMTEEATAEPTEAMTEEATAEPTEAMAEEATAEPTEAMAEEATAEPDGPKYGGSLTVVTRAGGVTLDPAYYIHPADVVIRQSLYDNLVMIEADGTIKPELATSWETNDDLSSWTFNLRQGVKFHHGKEFKAEDVKFTFDRLLDPELTTQLGTANLSTVEDIVVLDDYTIRFDFSGPNGFFLETLRLEGAMIFASDVDVERLTLEEFGTGPFMLTEHEPGVRSVMVRNPDYWEEGKPYLDEIVILQVSEVATRSQLLQSGDADVVHGLELQSALAIEADPNTMVSSAPGPWIGITMRGDTPPFDNKLVRQAMQAAADRETLVQAATLGQGSVGYDHPIAPTDPRFTSEYAPPAYDPELAKSLLAQAGYENGIDVTLHTADIGPGHIEMAVAFQQSAAEAGIRVDVQRGPAEGYWGGVWFVEPLSTVHWSARGLDSLLSETFSSESAMNVQQYFNPVLDELIVKARGQDLEGQKETYAEIQRILIEDVPIVIVAFQPNLLGLRSDVRGVAAHPVGIMLVQDAWLDR